MTNQTIKITDLTCVACTKLSANRFRRIDGVEDVQVDLATGKASLQTSRHISLAEANAALQGTPYRAEEYDETDA